MKFIFPQWTLFITLFGVYYHVRKVKSDDLKIWTMDTNFENPRNWENGRLPCPNDKIIFPSSASVVTFMPASFSFAEMVLPLDGGLIFPENAAFTISGGTQEGACVGKDVYYKPPTDFWYDPSNWNISSPRAFPNKEPRRNNAVPHAYQVPCRNDRVRFPSRTSFKAHVDHHPVTVAAVEINDRSYANEEFQELLQTHTGRMLFPNNPSFVVTGTTCTDISGCICYNHQPPVFTKICAHLQCPKVECSDPIKPTGHCCPLCGANLIIKYKSGFDLKRLLGLNQEYLEKTEYQAVESFAAKISEGNVQITFVDSQLKKGLANIAARQIHRNLLSDMSGPDSFKIRSVEMLKSEKWGPGVPTYGSYTGKGLSSGGIAAIILVQFVVIGLLVAAYIYKKRHIPGFTFARFDLHSDKIELQLGTTPHDELEPGDAPAASAPEEKDNSFDNPIYGAEVSSEASPQKSDSNEEKNIVENPMFMIFEDQREE